MNRFESLGLIINPRAGQGFAVSAQVARAALRELQPDVLYTGPDELGASAVSETAFPSVKVLPTPGQPCRAQTQALASQMARLPLSAILVVGGDGTLADVAGVLIGLASEIPVLGIGVGSTNAGNLVTCRAAEIEQLKCGRLCVEPLRALLAYDGSELMGIGFNDCVLGYTLVGTLNNVVQDLDAAARMAGSFQPGIPRSIGTNQTLVQRLDSGGSLTVARGRKIATLVIGFAEPAFFAKAITGGVCLAALVQAPAGCLTADVPLVQIGLDRQTVLQMPPIVSSYATFAEDQRIRVSGVRKGTVVCVDGNPLKILQPGDVIEFGVAVDAVRSLRLA